MTQERSSGHCGSEREDRPTHPLWGPPNLAEVFGSDPVIISAGKLVHKCQHLVLGPDELGLDRAAWGTQEKMGSRATQASHPATSQAHVPDHAAPATTPPARLTGLCLEGWLCAGRSALVRGPAESAPRWSWPHCWRACAPSAGRRCQVREPTASWAPAAASVAANSTEGPTVCLTPLHLRPVRPPKDWGPV